MTASGAPAAHPQPLLEVRSLSKSFAGVRALRGVDLEVLPGEVHCVLGQNGAGKSTLIKALSGVYQPDGGEIRWNGEPVQLARPADALALGIATMYQELDVVDGLTVTENIFLGHEDARGGVLRVRDARRRARDLLARLGHNDLSASAEVGSLSAAGKQIVSMARALSRNARLIIMDEPSAILDSGEVANLFRVIRELTAQGIAVVYISHRLEEIRQIGNRISVIKDGYSTASALPVAETSRAELVRLMTGRDVANVFPPRQPPSLDAPVALQVEGLALDGSFRDVSFEVRAGEIFGLAGLVGSGRSEILETIYGARRATSGTVTVEGRTLRPGSVRVAVNAGLGLSPEERKSQGLLLEEPIYRNVTLSTFARFARHGWLNERAEKAAARKQAEALQLNPPDPDRQARTLSGGNQQKVLLARWLIHGTRVLLLDEPTRGVDVGAKTEIYSLIRTLAATGVAIVVVSSEIEEVLGLADRILVLDAGRVLATGNAEEMDEHAVLDLVLKGSAQ
ncbi:MULTISPECIES: sugar ABC transporter ATP-binding protein [unclassified Arthrobacter]|uniref:sugar ABC transporter ATP-binding protein n=1 Tax=unclassified Arthrobacter TaxID=235627 RepID=UPI001E31CD5D|nr:MULTISPECIES: sugar ABC transporter ATP-binding protein [unclassified Arthrobacter]MCC9145914.1 sugar ABC transporter ATP-binding protein [Arthrobacter sp. zg-Y919]MDK1277143.1 sugar ABC transporter ATP-binding protein [Arthrobacter sp. zg.Y919]WIB03662.1 sugar ABC transporter ATP-binding protein [Arthrobacter sp. zg-Y919]